MNKPVTQPRVPARRPMPGRRPGAMPASDARVAALRTPAQVSEPRVAATPARTTERNESPAAAIEPAIEAAELQAPERATSLRAPSFDFESIENTSMFVSLASIRAQRPSGPLPKSLELRSIREARGLSKKELFAIAEVGYHYLRCGGYRLAEVIFEGLAAIDPEEAYFALACGLVADRRGNVAAAKQWYETARRLDPRDARADLNLAELALGAGERGRGAQLLASAVEKARAANDDELTRIAETMRDLASLTSKPSTSAKSPALKNEVRR
ncbi:hypothetical protein L6R52_06055 [Myxococcota bacterium]|nr:hypothetical protein [Myxococcota bacterium]